MKNAALILNAVLLAAVAVLFYLHFSTRKADAPVIKSASRTDTFCRDFRIAYIEPDSITNSFAMVKDVQAELSREEDRLNAEMNRMQKMYNDKLSQYQGQQLSQVQSEAASREMMDLQERMKAQRQDMEQKYQDLIARKRQEVKTKVEQFLKEYNKTKGFSYILANEPGLIYYRDTIYNITSDVLKGLNAEYAKKK